MDEPGIDAEVEFGQTEFEDVPKIEIIDVELTPVEVEEKAAEVVKKQKVVEKTIVSDIGWLQKERDRLRDEVELLNENKQKVERETQKELSKVSGLVKEEAAKLGEVVTKKVAALEVYKQCSMTNRVIYGLLVIFTLLQVFVNFKPIVALPDLAFIGLLGWHLVMNKRKMENLKAKYQL